MMALPHTDEQHRAAEIEAMGGEPLVGSGFEDETPDDEYSEVAEVPVGNREERHE